MTIWDGKLLEMVFSVFFQKNKNDNLGWGTLGDTLLEMLSTAEAPELRNKCESGRVQALSYQQPSGLGLNSSVFFAKKTSIRRKATKRLIQRGPAGSLSHNLTSTAWFQ